MNTVSTAQTQFLAGVRRWLYTGLPILLALTLSLAAPQSGHSESIVPAIASNGSGGGCG